MENEIYRRVLVPINQTPDRENQAALCVTHEVNCYAVWKTDYKGAEMVNWFDVWSRDKAIEFAVTNAPRIETETREKYARIIAREEGEQ